MAGPLRVVQWSTGTVGRRALAAILDMPHLELVGVHAHSADKVGKDAGELVGRPPTGVIVTGDVAELVALQPDCISYMPSVIDYDLVCRFLRSGINVVTTGDFLTGACRTGKRAVRIVETLDCTTYPVAAAWEAMGFGKAPSPSVTLTPESSPFAVAYFETLDLEAGMLGVPIDKRELTVEAAVATRDLDLGWARYPKGTVAGQRRTYRGYADGRCIVELALCWTMSDDALDPPLPRTEGLSDETDTMSLLMVGTAMSALHAVAHVCAAQPGVVVMSDLPVIGVRTSLC